MTQCLCPLGGLFAALCPLHHKDKHLQYQPLIEFVIDQGDNPEAALEMLRHRNVDLGHAWARGYNEGLRTP